MIRWSLRSLAAALLVLFLSIPAAATQVVLQSLEELGESSARIVQGRVEGARSFWNDAGTKILTEIEISVDRSWKGEEGPSIRVLQMGGVVDNVRMSVHGAVQWNAGQEVMLMLEESLPGRYRVAGFHQGRFDIERDGKTGEVILRRSAMADVEFSDGRGKVLSGDPADPLGARLSLDEFAQRLGLSREGGR